VTIPIGLFELLLLAPDNPVIRSVEMDGYQVTLYDLDCGALCDFGVGVDQERILVPPVKLTQRLYVFDDAESATVEILGKNHLRVTTLPFTDQYPNIRIRDFQIKPYFFF
jgi:hypothetical protein